MSFWPFTSALSNNSALQTFLDSVQDVSAVTVEDLFGDPQLLQELCNELDNIKRTNNIGVNNFQFLLNQASDTFNNNQASSYDNVSLESSLNELSNTNSKDGRSLKLLEILLQPHILNGFLGYLVDSVEYFHRETISEQARIDRLLECEAAMSAPASSVGSSGTESPNNEGDSSNAPESKPDKTPTDENDGNSLESMSSASRSTRGAGASEDEEQESEDEKMRRCVEAACDILAIDLWVILNRIIETPLIMSKLWLVLSLDHLDESSPSVTYLVRILDQLMDANSIELLNFVRRQTDLAGMIIDKIDVPLIIEFVMRIIQSDKADSPTGILETLSLQRLIPRLVEILKPRPSQFTDETSASSSKIFFKQMAISDFIKSLVAISSNTALAPVAETNIGPNQLTRELVSRPIISIMINDIILFKPPKTLDGKSQTNKHGINNCVGIIIELIRKNNSDYDLNCGVYSSELPTSENGVSEVSATVMCKWLSDFALNPPGPRDPIYLGEMLELFSDNLEKLNAMMAVPPIPQYESEERFLGMTNFRVSELIAELLHCSNMILLNSHRMKQVRRLRDYVRAQQSKRLKVALTDEILAQSGSTDGGSLDIEVDGLDDIEFGEFDVSDGGEELPTAQRIQSLSLEEDSDDEEPVILPERPFVCHERDIIIRKKPCIGDYFKIRLLDLGLMVNIIRKFTEFPWNNFFHNVVFDLVQQIFNGKLNSYNSFLIVELFEPSRCSLTSLIDHAYNDCAEPRPGYMGHLVLISEEVVKFTSLYKPDLISPVIVAAVSSESWEHYVTDTLSRIRDMYNVVLGGEGGHDSDDFDPNGMGYLDEDGQPRNKGVIVLGDDSNQKQFASDVHLISNLDDDDDEDVSLEEEAKMPEVPVQRMSPSGSVPSASEDPDGQEEYFPETDYLENSDTDSSEDEIEADAQTPPANSSKHEPHRH